MSRTGRMDRRLGNFTRWYRRLGAGARTQLRSAVERAIMSLLENATAAQRTRFEHDAEAIVRRFSR